MEKEEGEPRAISVCNYGRPEETNGAMINGYVFSFHLKKKKKTGS